MTPDAVVDRFFAAMIKRDLAELDALYDDDAKIWHNFDNYVASKAEIIDNVRNLPEGMTLGFEFHQRLSSGDSVAVRFDNLTLMNGVELARIFAAMFLTVRNGKITDIQEYMDSAQFPKQT